MARGEPRVDILIPADAIERRVAELGKAISVHYGTRGVVAVAALKGALVFLADLIRRIDSPIEYELARVASYGDGTAPARRPHVELLDEPALAGREILVVEDIVDTGHSLQALLDRLRATRAAGIQTCALLDKPARRAVEIRLDWVGFTIPDAFVVGYGLDHAQRYRHLPHVGVLREPNKPLGRFDR